jgi:hypothetical protein
MMLRGSVTQHDPRCNFDYTSAMSIKTVCDGCGDEIKPWKSQDSKVSDGLTRALQICTGNIHETWDLCDPCQDRVANAIAEALPYKPRESWFPAIRPKRTTT